MRITAIRRALAVCVLILASPPVVSGDIVLGIGLAGGGDKIVDIYFAGGSSSSIKAGEGIQASVGILNRLNSDGSLQAQLSAGFISEKSVASNGEVTFKRMPVDLILYWNTDWVSLGIGGTYHFNPKLKGTGFASGLDLEFEDAQGTIFELRFPFDNNAFIARYTDITYSVSGVEVDGSSLGLHFMFYF